MRRDSAKRHMFGGCTRRRAGMTRKFKLSRDFCAMHLSPKFHNPIFSRLEVIVLTNTSTNPQINKRILLKTSDVLCHPTTLGKNAHYVMYSADSTNCTTDLLAVTSSGPTGACCLIDIQALVSQY